MKIFLSTCLLFLAAKLRGKLPKGKYHLSRHNYAGHKLPVYAWCFLAHAGNRDENGDYAIVHVVNSSGIWDSIKKHYVVLWK